MTDLDGRTFAAVLFDMDGTLLSSISAVERSWTTLALELSIPASRFGDLHGMPARSLLEILLPDATPAERDEALDRVTALELADLDGVHALPGAADALAVLAPAGLGAVVTSSSAPLARARLAAAGLREPSVVVTADDVTTGKPDPEPFVLAARRLGVDPRDCLVAEDATAGITAARAAGSATLALTTTYAEGRITGDLVVPDLGSVEFTVVEGGVRVRLR